ncbi:hypothetical protein [Microbispora bryophytorum]|uniref:Uncharacterized protein n=1 Tax=Microbispora bryophytorum TaxID=1460882 RepID=A0A8H9H3B9_9ACTN|nr:hypothetical protein [Microbispora bryophytorum]MBD3139457.1 hypothetical protein [Microbispora bryophytorum]GGO23606.1 hypothetical protein GCM10011574_53170 [Microbispora bryophytorum]
MYRFLWRRLPGGTVLRLAVVLLLSGAAMAALWYVVFPWLAPRVPIG